MSANISSTTKHPPAALAAPPAAPVPAPALPPGLFGAAPRTIVIHRPDARHGFGFTLRHLVVYPPDSLNELYDDGRHLAVGVLGAPMDTIFVRSVRAGGPAAAAGLRAGDRVVAVNDEPVLCGGGGRARAPYARVVQLAQREPRMLRLTVVPRDHDLLQRYFSEAAYNPETNQRPRAVEMPAPTLTAEHESRLFDAYRKPRALLPSLPGPQAPPREADDAPEYSSVASLQSARYDPPRAFRDDRRESDASLPSAAESKDSLGSFDSGSTLTGRELDDSIILSRIRKSLEQKEAFLRRPSQPTGWVTPDAPPPIKQKEFYARPQKMQKTSWPPPATSPPPVQEVRQREDDCAASVDSGTYSGYGEINGANIESKSKPKSDKNVFVTTLSKIQENAPSTGDSLGSISNGSSSIADDSSLGHASMQDNRYPIPAELQIVTARTRQFESPASEERTALYRSELARLSTTKPEPTVALRRREYETRGVGAGRREARSLDAQPSREEVEIEGLLGSSLSGNRLMITGSKHLHCPPPEGYVPEVEKVQMRTRSNSTGSEGLPTRRHHASGFADDSVTRRQKKDAQMGEEERAMRRVSYLKATWGDRLHLDSDTELSDADNHALRSLEKKGEETSSPPALDEELEGERGVDIHGNVQVKMVVSNGKRASDRSWKQVWAALQGPKLHLYRHHSNQSPATASSGGVSGGGDPHGSRDSLDVRYSMAVLADDYTKRKHVLRLTTAAGAELLLQADGAADAARWLRALKRHSAEPAVPPAPLANNNNNTDTHGLSPLPPQRSKKIGRNRSPTGPPTPTLPSSPKTKTWKGRMARQLRRMHGGGGGATAPAAATGWLGAPLERCPSDPARPGVPLAVSLCAAAVEAAGLRTVGVYRVPGNAAGVASLAAALDRGEPPPPGDTRWADVHVASSLLKNYLRRLPDSLLTADLYPAFIAAERAPPAERARELRRLVRALPDAHYETLKFLMEHLRRIVAHSDYNKMEARNLAIVFGPTLVRGADDDMLAMVNDMSSQCRIIESLVNHYEWYFDEDDGGSPIEPPCEEELAPSSGNRELLIHNVKKIEGKDVSTRDIVSSIISAANRKIQRKPRSKPSASTEATKKWSESTDKSPVSPRMASAASPGGSPPNSPPPHLTTPLAQYDGLPIRSYSTLNQTTQERIKKFELETIAMLQRAGAGRGGPGGERTEAPSRAAAADLVSKELAAVAGKRLRSHADLNIFSVDGTGDLVSSLTNTFDQKLRTLNNSSPLDDGNIPYADECQDSLLTLHEESKLSETTPSEGSINSEERVSPSIRTQELKTAWLSRDHRKSSSSSAEETDGKFDKYKVTPGRKPSQDKSKYRYDSENDSEKENCENPKKTHERNYEEKTKSPENKYECNDSEKDVDTTSQHSGEALPDNDKSIERLLYSPTYPAPASTPAPAPAPRATLRLSNPECIKRNSAVLESDTEPDLNKKENNSEGVKLKRSESLNREPERSESRVLRSESLNCRTESRLQRSESLNKAERLSKLEKTESNLVRRREAGAWRSTKLKRKNGMPERGIKRRHTVGGTKDFDKDGWSSRHTRTSSPDLTHVCLAPLVPPPRPPLESHV